MNKHYDVLVVGAGPAGLAASHAAASHGSRVGLIDAQASAGGQVWRNDVQYGQPRLARRSIHASCDHAGVTWLPQTQVVAAEHGALLLENPQGAEWVSYGALVLATGARELLPPFPGWTLPGVTGAGALQALAKQGWPLAGKRVVIAGSGPLLFAAAATARRHGAKVLAIYEQATAESVNRFAYGLWRWPAKLLQAAWLRGQLASIPYHTGSTVRAAVGENALRAIELVTNSREHQRIECDHLAIGYGLTPNVELAQMLGCDMQLHGAHPYVVTNTQQCSSIARVYAAGELCGIGGRDSARIEGRIAGLAACGKTADASLLRQREHARAFASSLRQHFALDSRIYGLAKPDTLICRCEDVPLSALNDYTDARGAKLATRCGMGACQGRICGTALAELGYFPRSGQRPPLFPARLSTLGNTHVSTQDDHQGLTP